MTTILVIAKLLPVTALPIATIILWQKRTNANWISLPLCVVAYGINYAAQEFLGEPISQFTYSKVFVPLLVFFAVRSSGLIFFPWVLNAFIFGLIREGGRWLLLRPLATKVKFWQDGVLFGIGYSCLVLFFKLEWYYGNISPEHWNQIKGSFTEIANWLDGMLHPLVVWYFPALWAFTYLLFNIVTSVLVLASVQKRKILYLLVAITVYALYNYVPTFVSEAYSRMGLDWIGPPHTSEIIQEITRSVVSLLFLWPIIRLRKTMSQTER